MVNVGYYIIYVLSANRNTDIIIRYACCELFGLSQLLVGRAGGVNHQSFAVADIGEMAGQFDAVDKFDAGFFAALDSKTEDSALTFREVPFGKGIIGVGL